MLKGRILEERGDKSAARARFDKALGAASDFFDGRTTRRVAKQRLAVLGGSGRPRTSTTTTSPRCAQKEGPARLQGVPAGDGSVVTAKCSE